MIGPCRSCVRHAGEGDFLVKTAIAGVFAVSVLVVSILLASPAYPQSLPPGGPAAFPPAPDAASKIDPLLQAELQSAQPGQMVTAIVTLKEQVNLRSIGGFGRADRQGGLNRAPQ